VFREVQWQCPGAVSLCHLAVGTRCPLQRCAMPWSHQHSPPEGFLTPGSGFGFSISSKLCCAQRILDFLFRETVAMSVFPHLGVICGGFGLTASSAGSCSAGNQRTHPTCGESGCRWRPAPVSSQNRGSSLLSPPWVQDLSILGQTLPMAGPAHWLLHGRGSRSDALGGYQGLGIAQQPWSL